MKIVVVGGTTALGQLLVRALCASAAVEAGETRTPGEPILSLDVVRTGAAHSRLFVDERLGYVTGDPAAPAWLAHVMGAGTTSVFVLAPALARDDADAELRATVDAVRALLEACRAGAGGAAAFAGMRPQLAPRFVLVCTESPGAARAPAQVRRARRIEIARLLVADYSDRGHVDGRIVVLPSVVEAPEVGATEPTDIGAWLGWAIGESIAGRGVSCPRAVGPWALVSAPAAVRAIVEAHQQPATRWTPIESRARRVAAIQASAAQWLESLQAVAPAQVAGHWSIGSDSSATGGRECLAVGADRGEAGDPLPGDENLEALLRASFAQAMGEDRPRQE